MDLTILKRKRGAVKSKLTNFAKFLLPIETLFMNNETITDVQLTELDERVANIVSLLHDFETIQDDIESICDDDDLNAQYDVRDAFINEYSAKISVAKTIIKEYYKTNNVVNSSDDNESIHSIDLRTGESPAQPMGVKLPTISLPKFDGNYKHWLEFKDTFQSLINDNNAINNVQKFHYLRASLERDALKIIQALEFSAQNYAIAWELLCKRFDNSRLLVHNHIKAFFYANNIVKGTSSEIRYLLDNVTKHLRCLKALNRPTEHWDDLIIFILTAKLDKDTAQEWEKQKTLKDFPLLEDMTSFLKSRADLLETLEINVDSKYTKRAVKSTSLLATKKFKCNFCQGEHLIYGCKSFLGIPVQDRVQHVSRLKLCSNCLCTGHGSDKCRSKGCKKCGSKHNSLLHLERENDAAEPTKDVNSQISLSSHISQFSSNDVLLSTVVLHAIDNVGNTHELRALLDSGSQSNFITYAACQKLKLPKINTNLNVVGLNRMSSKLSDKCSFTVKSRHNKFNEKIECLVINKITDNLPTQTIQTASLTIPSHIQLADQDFNVSREIDLLLGASLFWNALSNGKIILGKNMPVMQNTVFGWIISGPISEPMKTVSCNFSMDSNLSNDLQKFWAVEECIQTPFLSKENKQCEAHFIENFSRDFSGKFVVRLPLKSSPNKLGDSKHTAIKRLLDLEKRFKMNNELKSKYIDFLNEYKSLGHMTLVNNLNNDVISYFLPHHGVLKEDSLTTKLRVVFNGSSATDTGISLNDLQFVGPPVLNDIFNILIRFRRCPIVVSSDIEKMYRQILIHPDDRFLQMILWRDNSEKPIDMYTLNTVTYGTTSAPYLAVRCLKQLALDFKHQFPVACERILNDFYVDDLLTGFENENEASEICLQIDTILKSANFKLRKWVSNNSEILKNLQDPNEPISILHLGDNDQLKLLGLQWKSSPDLLSYHIKDLTKCKSITKRLILSDVAKIYDPLGLVSPCVILAKIMIQRLWIDKIDWDEQVNNDVAKRWSYFRNTLNVLNELSIPRFVFCKNPVNIQFHGYCDASQEAYCACIYVRSMSSNSEINVKLLCAKTKVAPVKILTIPRLELCSALMLTRLMNRVCDALKLDVDCYYWSDSKIVLCWLQTEPSQLQVFVANRVNEIQTSSNVLNWNHVSSKDNPADVGSRGAFAEVLLNSTLWWSGPNWLKLPEQNWPSREMSNFDIEIPELKKSAKAFHTTNNDDMIIPIKRYSSFAKLRNITAYCLRFMHNLKACVSKTEKLCGKYLTPNEHVQAITKLVELVQRNTFSNEINTLKLNKFLNKRSYLIKLSPFIDEKGLLRVGGRLKYSQLDYNAKHPILLPKYNHFTNLLVEYEHKRLLHAGPQLVLFTIRQTYWIVSGITVVKRVIRNCIVCHKFKPKPYFTEMSNLPEARVTEMYPFYVSGVDYAGPFLLKDRKGRGAKTFKAYVCLFICFSSKAVHMELVTELTTDCFIACLRRFCSRRGKPCHLYSDNGTNFIGAINELNVLHEFLFNSENNLKDWCANERINWHLIPPNSPHFGGLWESNIKSAKSHLLKTINGTLLTYEEFYSVIVQIEGILNSRPLCPLSNDPNDLTSLTPSHFLIGRSLTTVPDPDVCHISMNKLSRYQLIQQLQQSFWKRWSREYLNNLQPKGKWTIKQENLEVGTMVLIKQDNLPSCNWALGRIVETHPGSDGIVRVVSVKTAKGVLRRAVTKVCPLPIAKNNNEKQ